MDEDVRAFGEELGRKVLARDWGAVHAMLALWLQSSWTVERVQQFFEDEYRATLEDSGIADMHYPEYPDPEVGGNGHTKATDLRRPLPGLGEKVRDVSPEVTDENVRYWLRVQLQCSDDQRDNLGFDYFSEVWIAVVDTPGGLRVGYWSQGAY